MKTPEEIRNDILIKGHRYASTKCRIKSQATFNKYEKILGHFVDGYEQCKTDMADKKYTEEDLENAFNSGRGHGVPDNIKDFDSFINSLNKQD
jgi:hypothetical protein